MMKPLAGLARYTVAEDGEVIDTDINQPLLVTKEDGKRYVAVCIGGYPTDVAVEVLYAWAYTEHPFTLSQITTVRVKYKNKRKGLRPDNVTLYLPTEEELKKELKTEHRMYRSRSKKRHNGFNSVPYHKLSNVAKQRRKQNKMNRSTVVHGPHGTVNLNFDI